MRASPDQHEATPAGPPARKAGVKRTALLVAAIAVAIYAAFILSGVLAQ